MSKEETFVHGVGIDVSIREFVVESVVSAPVENRTLESQTVQDHHHKSVGGLSSVTSVSPKTMSTTSNT